MRPKPQLFRKNFEAFIGFHEEFKARQSLDALKAQMTATVPVKRDGEMVIIPVAELVPGDVIFLRGGNIVPADCEFLEAPVWWCFPIHILLSII